MVRIVQGILTFFFLFSLANCSSRLSESTHSLLPTTESTSLPTSESNQFDFSLFGNPNGFASLHVFTRMIDDENYALVENEIMFIEALMNPKIKIIEVHADLNLGSKYVTSQFLFAGKSIQNYRDVYRPHSKQPLLHPILIDNGIGQVRLINRDGLLIFSKTGHTIQHTTFIMDQVSDVVIRNLHLTGIWEWDEVTEGNYDRNDWDYFTIEKSNGIWLDHITFDQAYDGIVDVKEQGRNITLSWSKLSFKPNPLIEAQIQYLEEHMTQYPYYKSLRDLGVSYEDMILYSSFQKKGFNLGNTTDGENFESITMTFHHLVVENLMDRLPRLRKGDVHLYHILFDNTDVYQMKLRYPQGLKVINQGIITTEQGAVLMEHSIYRFVTTPIRNHQDSNSDPKYTGSYQVINSEITMATRTFFGSSTDRITYWTQSNSHAPIAFMFRNHEMIPYHYDLIDVFFLVERLETYPVGSGFVPSLDWTHLFWNSHHS